MSRLLDNYQALHEQITQIAGGRKVQLLPITKTRPIKDLQELYDFGLRCFGENREQELALKVAALPKDIQWHFIGPLQGNKVRKIVRLANVIHSVDSLELLDRLNRIAGEEGRTPEIYLEVNISGETSKGGMTTTKAMEVAAAAGEAKNIKLLGLMTMAPLNAANDELKNIFTQLKVLGDSLKLSGLSMGMSGDYATAIECGSTLVRIGSAIFAGVPKE